MSFKVSSVHWDRHSNMQTTSAEDFQKKYVVKSLDFNSHAGLFESYYCEARKETAANQRVYLQALRI